MKHRYTSVSIPVDMHKDLEKLIKDTSFVSVSEFVKHVLRDIISSGKFEQDKLSKNEIEMVRRRLKSLGYYD